MFHAALQKNNAPSLFSVAAYRDLDPRLAMSQIILMRQTSQPQRKVMTGRVC